MPEFEYINTTVHFTTARYHLELNTIASQKIMMYWWLPIMAAGSSFHETSYPDLTPHTSYYNTSNYVV